MIEGMSSTELSVRILTVDAFESVMQVGVQVHLNLAKPQLSELPLFAKVVAMVLL